MDTPFGTKLTPYLNPVPSQLAPQKNTVRTCSLDKAFVGHGGWGLAQGLGIGLFAFGGAYWPPATAHSDPPWVRTCVGLSTEPPDDLSFLTAPGSAVRKRAVARAVDQVHPHGGGGPGIAAQEQYTDFAPGQPGLQLKKGGAGR